MFRMFKAPDRGETDGLKDNFRMNKSELELRNLIDLGFVVQDYETTIQNAEFPIGDFRRIQAFKNAAHCEEIQMFSKMALDGNFLTRDFKEFVATADKIFETYHKKSQSPAMVLIKFSIYLSEIYQFLGKHKEAADVFIRLATVLGDKHMTKPLFFEQAAYEYLYLK
jgi:hypothetical protein